MIKDVITFGEAMGMLIADESGDLSKVTKFTKNMAGAETNVAIGLARLGLRVGWVSRLGEDSFGRYIIETLEKECVDVSNVTFTRTHSTGFLMKSKTQEGDPCVEYFRKFSAGSTISLEDYNDEYFSSSRHLHATGIPAALSESAREFSMYVMNRMKEMGKTVSFDPNLRPSLWTSQKDMIDIINNLSIKADILMPGITEGKVLTGYDNPSYIADYYIDKGVKLVVIKMGKQGAYYKTMKEEGFVPGFKVERVIDTVGAGDGFAVGVISAMLEGLTIDEAVTRGNAIGALAVMNPGDKDGLPTREQLNNFLNAVGR